MGESKAVSIRIPDDILAKVDKLAEEKYTSIKGKPNRSLVIQNAIVAYFDTLSDSVFRERVNTVSDNVDIEEFKVLRQSFDTLSDTVRQINNTVSLLVSESKPSTLSNGDLAVRLKISSSTLSHWRSPGKKGKTAEEFLKATREKDPDGIGWEPIPGTSRFKPEREIGTNPTGVIQLRLQEEKTASLSEGEAEAQTNHP
jgi:metal-responsive CopG/Arc/MetJ family transcriptional regulator